MSDYAHQRVISKLVFGTVGNSVKDSWYNKTDTGVRSVLIGALIPHSHFAAVTMVTCTVTRFDDHGTGIDLSPEHELLTRNHVNSVPEEHS